MIAIVGAGALSAAGWGREALGANSLASAAERRAGSAESAARPPATTYALPPAVEALLDDLHKHDSRLRRVDRTVLLAIAAAEAAVAEARWLQPTDPQAPKPLLINIGSSRGATAVWESQHAAHAAGERLSPFASPLSTTGNVASWVGQRLLRLGLDTSASAAFSHSITCSSALFAIANGVAWLRAGMTARALVGGAEAPLTPFTIAQMQALGVYAPQDNPEMPWPPPSQPPCQPFGTTKYTAGHDTMMLGEGAAMFALQASGPAPALAHVAGVGWATETIPSAAGLSAAGHTLHLAMQTALQDAGLWDASRQCALPEAIDVVIAHAPGTRTGDTAELAAIQQVVGTEAALPYITSTKWRTGHTLGAAGGLNIALALALLAGGSCPPFPYPLQAELAAQQVPSAVRRVLVNAVGFGGTACSVLLTQS